MWTQGRCVRSAVALVVSAAVVTGCAGSGGGSSPTDSAAPPATELTGQTSGWSADADAACRRIFDERGRPPRAQSGDVDDDMALAEDWHADLAFRAARDLAELPAAPSGAQDLVNALLDYQKASTRIAEVYLEGGYQPTKLSAAEAARDDAQTSVERLSTELKTPSCALVVNTTE
jgi:ABC-type glycerol-3-phosphate transport system substrate-binding protein